MEEITAKDIIERYSKLGKIGNKDALNLIPKEERRYKCHTCHLIVDESPCPNCKETQLEIMCPLDHCHCGHDVVAGIKYCPLCGDTVCPEDGCHDVATLSRVTGYYANTASFNAGKQQELKDRTRYNNVEKVLS